MVRKRNINAALNLYYLSFYVAPSIQMPLNVSYFAEFVSALLENSQVKLAFKVVANAIKTVR